MWGEQNLLRKRDELIQKLRGVMPVPTTEIDELHSCKGKKLKYLIKEIEKLYNEVLVPISAKTKTIATHTDARNKLRNQYNEIERQKEKIIQEADGFEEGSQEYIERLEELQSLINKGKPLPVKITRYDNEISAASDAKTVLEIVLIEESMKRTVTTKEEERALEVKIAKLISADKTNEEIRADLADLAGEVTSVGVTKSSTSEAEELIAKSRREKQTTTISNTKKSQPMSRNIEPKINLLPLAEEEY